MRTQQSAFYILMAQRLLCTGLMVWWGLPVMTAELATLLLQFTTATEAVLLASFFSPWLCLCWWFSCFAMASWRSFFGYLVVSGAVLGWLGLLR